MANWNQAGRITVNTNATEQTLVMAVMVLETPFGRMKVTIDRYIAKDDDAGTRYDRVYVYDPDRCSLAVLRPYRCVELAKTGDSIKCQSIMEATFVMLGREERRQVQEVRDRLTGKPLTGGPRGPPPFEE